jgi:hypothetical protein
LECIFCKAEIEQEDIKLKEKNVWTNN